MITSGFKLKKSTICPLLEIIVRVRSTCSTNPFTPSDGPFDGLASAPDATKLVELDLGFNCFGAKGGEAIGASLHVNTCLKV